MLVVPMSRVARLRDRTILPFLIFRTVLSNVYSPEKMVLSFVTVVGVHTTMSRRDVSSREMVDGERDIDVGTDRTGDDIVT